MSSELQTRPWLPWLLVFVKPLAIYNGYRAHRHTPHVKPTVIREMQNIILQGLMLEAKILWQNQCQLYKNHHHMNQARIVTFQTVLDPEIISDIKININAMANVTFPQVLHCYIAKYGAPGPNVISENKEHMQRKWDLAHQDIAQVICQIHDGHYFTEFIHMPYTDAKLVQMAEPFVLETCHFKAE